MSGQFIDGVKAQLTHLYSEIKEKRTLDEAQKHRIEGFISAGLYLGLVEKKEISALIEEIHLTVFGQTVRERKLEKLMGEQESIDWSIYDTPPSLR